MAILRVTAVVREPAGVWEHTKVMGGPVVPLPILQGSVEEERVGLGGALSRQSQRSPNELTLHSTLSREKHRC